jgi:hypothetical protein
MPSADVAKTKAIEIRRMEYSRMSKAGTCYLMTFDSRIDRPPPESHPCLRAEIVQEFGVGPIVIRSAA